MSHPIANTQWLPVNDLTDGIIIPGALVQTVEQLSTDQVDRFMEEGCYFSEETLLINHHRLSDYQFEKQIYRLYDLRQAPLCFCLTKLIAKRDRTSLFLDHPHWFKFRDESETILHVIAKEGKGNWSSVFVEYVNVEDAAGHFPLYYVLAQNSPKQDSLKNVLIALMKEFNQSLFSMMIKHDIPKLITRENKELVDVEEMVEFHAYKCIKEYSRFAAIPNALQNRVFVLAVAHADGELALVNRNSSYATEVPESIKQYVYIIGSAPIKKTVPLKSTNNDEYDKRLKKVSANLRAAHNRGTDGRNKSDLISEEMRQAISKEVNTSEGTTDEPDELALRRGSSHQDRIDLVKRLLKAGAEPNDYPVYGRIVQSNEEVEPRPLPKRPIKALMHDSDDDEVKPRPLSHILGRYRVNMASRKAGAEPNVSTHPHHRLDPFEHQTNVVMNSHPSSARSRASSTDSHKGETIHTKKLTLTEYRQRK